MPESRDFYCLVIGSVKNMLMYSGNWGFQRNAPRYNMDQRDSKIHCLPLSVLKKMKPKNISK